MTVSENSSWRHRLLLWAIAIGLVALGIYLSAVRYMNTEWLSRAGCLIVILGIWSSVGSILQERLLSSRIRWRRRNALTKARARHMGDEVDPEQAQKELDEIDEAFAKSLTDATHKLRMTLGVLEVSLLMTGTFLWGFGDLLMAAL